MSIFKRNLLAKLPVLGMLALAAACGGGDDKGGQGGEQGGAGTAAPAPAPAAAQGQVHEVRMVSEGTVSGVFEPANITVKKGDVIRFTTDGTAPHNVSFPPAENAGAANLPAAPQYLTTAGQTVEVPITMDPGTYNYQCDPHAPMGMKGTITVQ